MLFSFDEICSIKLCYVDHSVTESRSDLEDVGKCG